MTVSATISVTKSSHESDLRCLFDDQRPAKSHLVTTPKFRFRRSLIIKKDIRLTRPIRPQNKLFLQKQ
jgi:hypothetical protein